MLLTLTQCIYVCVDVPYTLGVCVCFLVFRLSEEMTECFKWYEEHYPKWLHPDHNKTPQVIIYLFFLLPFSSPPHYYSAFIYMYSFSNCRILWQL